MQNWSCNQDWRSRSTRGCMQGQPQHRFNRNQAEGLLTISGIIDSRIAIRQSGKCVMASSLFFDVVFRIGSRCRYFQKLRLNYFSQHLSTPMHGLFKIGKQQMRLAVFFIINGLETLMMPAHPCAAFGPVIDRRELFKFSVITS